MVRPPGKRTGKYDWQPVSLTAADLEAITGLGRRMQIDWRSRGLLPKQGSRTERYTAKEVTEVLLLQRLRPKFPHDLDVLLGHVRRIAPIVLWYVLFEYKAWHFIGSPKDRVEFEKEMADKDNELYDQCREIIGVPKSWPMEEYYVWDGEDWHLTSNLHAEFLQRRSELQLAVNHFAIGDRLAEKLPGPLYEVRLKSSSSHGRR